MLESNIEEEETSKSRKEKPSYFILLHVLVLEEPLHTSSHAVRSCLCLYSVQYTSICLLCNCGLLYDLIGTTFFRLVLPSGEDSLFGRIYWTDNAKTYNTHSRGHERKLGIFRYHGRHLLTEDAAFLWKVKTRHVVFSWKSHSDSRRYFTLY